MQKLYRTDYEGEFLVDGFVIENGRRTENRVFIENTIVNNSHTKNACVIGNGLSRQNFPLDKIQNHAGGHLGKKRLQTYGCNAIYRDMQPDFLIAYNPFMVNEIVKSDYTKDHIVLTNVQNIKNHPTSGMHLFPYSLNMCAGALATWLACFDGHKKIYLFAFDNQDGKSNNNIYAGTPNYQPADHPSKSHKWEGQMKRIFDTYDDVEFAWVVGGLARFPEEWKYCLNLREIDKRDFQIEADL
jgi:hypothetical protein